MKGKKGQRSLFNGKLLFLFSFVLLMIGGVWNARTASAALLSPNPLEAKAQLTQPLSATALGDTTNILPQPRAPMTAKYNAVWFVPEDYELSFLTGTPQPTILQLAMPNNKTPIITQKSNQVMDPVEFYDQALKTSGVQKSVYNGGTNWEAYYLDLSSFLGAMTFGSSGGDHFIPVSKIKADNWKWQFSDDWTQNFYYIFIAKLRLKADPVQQVFPVGQTKPTSFNEWVTNIRWLEDDGKTWTTITSGYTVSLKTSWDSSKAGNFTYQVYLTYKGATITIDVPVQFVNKPSSTITFNFVDENGNQIRAPETKTGIQGANWSLPAPAIDGYTFDRSSSGAQSGAFGATDQTITYYYKKDQPAKEPLKVVFTKYNADKSQKLQGAQMEFQSLKETGKWERFNVSNDTTNYTTNQSGEIVLSQAVIDAIEYYGGTPNDQKFRFVEKIAPNGYVQPNGSSNPGAAFTSNELVLTKDTAGQQDFSLTNKKEAAAGGTVTVNYYEKGTTNKLATSVTLNGKVGETWQSTRNTTITTDGVTYTLDGTATLDGMNVGSTPALQGTFNANQRTVNYYYNAPAPSKPGNIIVYYWRDGNEVTSARHTIDTSGVAIGTQVVVPKPTGDWDDYTFNHAAINDTSHTVTTWPVKVTVTAAEQHVWVYYDKKPVEPKPASISVYYYIENTETPVHDMYSWVPTNAIGSQVQAPASQEYTYQGDTYELVSYKLNTTGGIATSTSNPISVTVSATQQSVYYYYRKKVAPPTPGQPVTVNYYIENTTNALQNSTTITGNVGDNKPVPTPPATLTQDGITYELTSAELDGTEVALPFGTVLITNQQRTLNFYYKATITPGGTVTVYYYQGQGNDTDKYTYVNGSKKELKGNVGDVFDVTSSSVGDFTGYKFKVAYINLNSPATSVTSPPVNVTVTDKAQTVWVYYEKEAPTYYLKQVKVPTQTYSAGINALGQGQWQELFGNGNMIAVMQTGNANPVAYLDQTTYTFMPTLDTTQTPWDSTVGTDRTFKVTITPTPNLLGKFPSLKPIVADAKLTFIDAAYTLQLMIRNQEGEVATFASSIDHPFMMQDISEGLGVNAWPYEGTVNATDRTIVGFPGFSFVAGTQYRVKQTATPGEDYPTLWNDGNMTKTFALTQDNKLTVFQGSGGGNPGDYAVANKEVKIDDTWSAKYDTSAKVLTFYFVNEEVPPGALTWTVPDDMDFGEVKTPVRQAQDIFLQAQPDQKNWQIAVSDTRQKNRNQWNITAQLTTPLINTVNQKQLAKNILKFKSTASGTAQDLSQATQIYQSAASPALGDTPLTWNSTSGFYLDLISNGYYPVGQYVGNVTFTLNTTP